jgi:hypothetical protein
MTELFDRSFHDRPAPRARSWGVAVLIAAAMTTLAACSVIQRGSAPLGDQPLELVLVDYNSFTDTTKVRTALVPLASGLEMYAGFRYRGQSMRESPKEVYIVFQETSPAPRWENPVGRALELVLDDSTRVRYDETEYLSDTLSGEGRLTFKVVEWVWVTLPAPEFQQIAKAEKVEGKLSRTSFDFDDRHRGALRALSRRLEANSTAQ